METPAGSGLALHGAESGLLARLRAGEPAACEEFVRAYGGRMRAATLRLLGHEGDADDAVQEAFLQAFRSLASFEGKSQLGTWVHRIAINAALMKLRSRKRRRESELDELLPQFRENGVFATGQPAWIEPADEGAQREETRAVVRACIEELPDNYRTALLLRDIEELDYPEIAAHLECSPNAAKVRVHRARQALRTLLARRLGAEGGA